MSKRTKIETAIPTKKKTIEEKKKQFKDSSSTLTSSSSYKASIPKGISPTITSRLNLILTEPNEKFMKKMEEHKGSTKHGLSDVNSHCNIKLEKEDVIFDPSSSHHRVFSKDNNKYSLLEAMLIFGKKKLIKILKREIEDIYEEDKDNYPASATLFYSIIKKEFSNVTDLFLDYYSELLLVNSSKLRKIRIRDELEMKKKEREEEAERMKKTLFGENIYISDDARCNKTYVERYVPYFMKKVGERYKLPEINYTYDSTILVMTIVDDLGYLNLFSDIEELCFEVNEGQNDIEGVPETNVFVLKDTNMGGDISFSLTHLLMKFDYLTILTYLLRISDINYGAVKGYLEAMRCIIFLKSSFPEPLNGLKDFFIK